MKKRLEGLLQRALNRAKGGAAEVGQPPPFVFGGSQGSDVRRSRVHGRARPGAAERKAPRAIAEAIIATTSRIRRDCSPSVEIEGPGYLNFRFSPRFWRDCLARGRAPDFGRPNVGDGRRVLVEFVSANPTGPLHVGHGRGAVIGDALARLLAAAGYEVTREYYVNDAGKQIDTLGRSRLRAAAAGLRRRTPRFPRTAIPASTCASWRRSTATNWSPTSPRRLARTCRARRRGRRRWRRAVPTRGVLPIAGVRRSAARRRWLLERHQGRPRAIGDRVRQLRQRAALRDAGVVGGALAARSSARGLLYDEGRTRAGFAPTAFGDEKDRVVQRSDGELTYFASDIGYHREKLERGFEQLIDVWGADHHGYIARVKAALQALGGDPSACASCWCRWCA